MEDIENRAHNNLSFTPIPYKRYEAILAIIPSDKIYEFVNTFNNIEEYIKFTIEK